MPLRRPCGGVQRESRRHGTVRWARRSRAQTSEPPFSNRGVQIGQDRRTTQNFEQNQQETEVNLQNRTWIMEFRAKRMQIGISEQNMAVEAGLTTEYYRRLERENLSVPQKVNNIHNFCINPAAFHNTLQPSPADQYLSEPRDRSLRVPHRGIQFRYADAFPFHPDARRVRHRRAG